MGKIVFIPDNKLSSQRTQNIKPIINGLRQIAQIEFLKAETTENEILEKLDQEDIDLVLVPWHLYQTWSKLEAHFGQIRTKGPTCAGYFADKLELSEIPSPPHQQRFILFDFNKLTPKEVRLIVGCLLDDDKRCGIRPLLDPDQKIYYENWLGKDGRQERANHLLSLNEIKETHWVQRANAIRISLLGLWSFLFEEGPVKSELLQKITENKEKAYFQFGCNSEILTMRLCFKTKRLKAPEVLNYFWPKQNTLSSATQLIYQFSDFVRVHTTDKSEDVEITICFFNSSPSEKSPDSFRTLWIDPVHADLWYDNPIFESSDKHNINLIPIKTEIKTSPIQVEIENQDEHHDPLLQEALNKIKKLKEELEQKNSTIYELKSGGVGKLHSSKSISPIELLESFQDQYLHWFSSLEKLNKELEQTPKANQALLLREVKNLENKEKVWIKVLTETLKIIKNKKDSIKEMKSA